MCNFFILLIITISSVTSSILFILGRKCKLLIFYHNPKSKSKRFCLWQTSNLQKQVPFFILKNFIIYLSYFLIVFGLFSNRVMWISFKDLLFNYNVISWIKAVENKWNVFFIIIFNVFRCMFYSISIFVSSFDFIKKTQFNKLRGSYDWLTCVGLVILKKPMPVTFSQKEYKN